MILNDEEFFFNITKKVKNTLHKMELVNISFLFQFIMFFV